MNRSKLETSNFPMPSVANRMIACCRCRQRKKRCDKRRPVCGECSRSNAECQPLQPKKTSMAKHIPLDYVHMLEDRVACLETKLKQSEPDIADDHLDRRKSLQLAIELAPAEIGPQLWMNHVNIGHSSMMTVDNSDNTQHLSAAEWEFGELPWTDQGSGLPDGLENNEDIIEEFHPETCDIPQRKEFARDRLHSEPRSVIDVSFRLGNKQLSLLIAEKYTAEYFSSAHPMWPFLHHKQWENWWGYWSGQARDTSVPDWRAFFVDMVLAVGGLLVYGFDQDPQHLATAKTSYQRAITNYDSSAFQKCSYITKTQSSLLLTIHAMHLDSVKDIFNWASEALKNSTLSELAHHRSRQKGNITPQTWADDLIRKMTNRSCIVIGLLLNNTMKQTVTLDDGSIDDENIDDDEEGSINSEELRLSSLPSSAYPSPADIALEGQMFKLRRIQFRILRLTQRLVSEAASNQTLLPNLWRSYPRYDLERWMAEVQSLSVTSLNHSKFQSPEWLLKLANYTIISLFPNPYIAIRGGESKNLGAAACAVLITFRKLRVRDNTTCFTWTALLHQFMAGVHVAFCLWATPSHQQSQYYDRRNVCQAMFSCAATLNDFCGKWRSASVFRDTFDILVDALPLAEYGDPCQHWSLSQSMAVQLRLLMTELEELKVQQKVMDMLTMMCQGCRPEYTSPTIEEAACIQYEQRDDPSNN